MMKATKHTPLMGETLAYWECLIEEYRRMMADTNNGVDDAPFVGFLEQAIADIRSYRTALRAIAAIQASESAMRVYRIATRALGAE